MLLFRQGSGLDDQLKGADSDASPAKCTLRGIFIYGEFSVSGGFEGIELFGAGSNAAAAAAAFVNICDYRWGGYRLLPHSGSSCCFHVVRRSSGRGAYCGQEVISATLVCLHFLRHVLQSRFISSSLSFMDKRLSRVS